jgi:hypothetical protein
MEDSKRLVILAQWVGPMQSPPSSLDELISFSFLQYNTSFSQQYCASSQMCFESIAKSMHICEDEGFAIGDDSTVIRLLSTRVENADFFLLDVRAVTYIT